MRSILSAALLACGLTALSAAAEPLPGVRFDIMPVGCRMHGTYNDGKRVVDEYMGRKGKSHITRTSDAVTGRRIRTTTYDSSGFMTRKDWDGEGWQAFKPFACVTRPGPCNYTYSDSRGERLEYRGNVVVRGAKVVSSGGFAGNPPFPDTVTKPGPFNHGEAFTEGTTSFRVTRYENCGDLRPSS